MKPHVPTKINCPFGTVTLQTPVAPVEKLTLAVVGTIVEQMPGVVGAIDAVGGGGGGGDGIGGGGEGGGAMGVCGAMSCTKPALSTFGVHT